MQNHGRNYIDRLKGKDKIAVWGTGLAAVKCIYSLEQEHITIQCVLNSNPKIETFCGYPVLEPDDMSRGGIRGCFIIVATIRMNTYLEIAEELRGKGLTEFDDFIHYEWMHKRVVLLHGNCHMSIIEQYLQSSRKFRDSFCVYPVTAAQNMGEEGLDENLLKNVDVCIHEDIREDNIFGYKVSDTYLKKYLSPQAIEIVMPHLFGLGRGFFPNTGLNHQHNAKIKNGEDRNGMFLYSDEIINSCVDKGMGIDAVIRFCKSRDCMDEKAVKENFELYMEKIKEREKNWDIKISRYILENYKSKKLFYDPGHPTNDIMEVIAFGVLEMLGVSEEEISASGKMDAHELPVYPAVREYLGLEWEEAYIRESPQAKKAQRMDFEEYIREYCWWLWGIR